MVESQPLDVVTPPAKGFMVHDDGVGYGVTLKVLYEPGRVDLDEMLASITAVLTKSFAEADKRLGPR